MADLCPDQNLNPRLAAYPLCKPSVDHVQPATWHMLDEIGCVVNYHRSRTFRHNVQSSLIRPQASQFAIITNRSICRQVGQIRSTQPSPVLARMSFIRIDLARCRHIFSREVGGGDHFPVYRKRLNVTKTCVFHIHRTRMSTNCGAELNATLLGE